LNVVPYWTAQINARLGNTNEVITFLNQAYINRDPQIINLLEDDHWDEYRDEKWFKNLLDQIGFHPIPSAVH
jgi:hypothetical protein